MSIYELGVLRGLEKAAEDKKDDHATMAAAGLMLGGGVAGGGIAKSIKHVSDFNAVPPPAPVAAAAKSVPSTVTKAIKTVGKVL